MVTSNSDGSKFAMCNVTVLQPVTGVELDKDDSDNVTLIIGGATATLTATVLPADASDRGVVWSAVPAGSVTFAPLSGSDGLTVTLTGVTAGGAVVTVTTDDGDYEAHCAVTVAAQVHASQPAIDAATPQDATANTGADFTLAVTVAPSTDGELSYQWYSAATATTTGGAAIEGATAASYTASKAAAGTFFYYVEVTNTITDNGDGGNKTATATSRAATVTVAPATGSGELETIHARVYPNPTDGALTIEFETACERVITLSDTGGKLLLRQTVSDATVLLDMSNYPVGVYLLTVSDGKQQTSTRIIKN
jgi:hypothetical protein